MKTFTISSKLFLTLGALGLMFSCFAVNAQTIPSDVPKEYYPNYVIEADWKKIQENFVQIEAAQKLPDSLNIELFRELTPRFKKVFSSFPQDYNFLVTYEQCTLLSDKLGSSYSQSVFYSFMNNCYKPLNQIISKINNQYTVKPTASRNPSSGSAPLTVTFDARTSKDPSSETIPSKNFYRYYRDTKGVDRVIGAGNVINHTFEEPGNYVVHLTVRSSNYLTKGILDGEMDLVVNVAPKAANIIVYANTKKLDKDKVAKIWTQEAQKGVVFNGSPTMPTGWRKIESHAWEITSRDGFKYYKEGKGSPAYINLPLNGNGEYFIKLSTIDNENNRVSETFSLTVSDPVAIMKQAPALWNTSTTFSFDSTTSYSLTSRLKLYTWEIFDGNGDRIDTFQGKNIKKQFIKPGNYKIILTIEDELGQVNVDTQQLYVDSTPPHAQFSIASTNKWAKSSEYLLDANPTTDVDVTNKNDSLEYKREYSNPNAVTTISTEDNNKQVIVQFNETGKHTIKLTVTDMYGKIWIIEKQIDIASTLRPELTINPSAVTRWRQVAFSTTANKPIASYQWNFGDGDTKLTQESSLLKPYGKVWIYNVSVTVSDTRGDNNMITERVFIGETGFPILAFKIKNSNGFYLQRNEGACEVTENGVTDLHDAYIIDRYQNVTIDPGISVNSKGTSANLRFYFQPKYDEVYQQTTFSYKFNEVGCQYIDVTVDDRSVNKQDFKRVWFQVNNALPTLKNIVLSFPQYGNESWIGFQQGNVQNILDPGGDGSSNLIVKANAVNAVDPDGNIAYFKWYYYPKDNPNKILETRITPSNIPYTFFTLPRVAGEYMFGVTIYDNDDGSQRSENVIGNGPTIFFPQSNNNPDIPIVTLKSDKQTVNIGDVVTFDVIAKITSENEDFYTERSIQYDFDGDGERDLITKKDRVTYTYTKPMERGYTPKAAVIYRGYKGVGEGNVVIVKNGIKPILTYNTLGNLVIFRDLSMGNIISRQLCFDTKECAAGNRQYMKTHLVPSSTVVREGDVTPITQNSVFLQKYPALGTHEVSIQLKSNQGIEVKTDYKVTTTNNTNNGRITAGVHMITIPETSFTNATPEIYVSKSMNNSILFYLSYEGAGTCFIDVDISQDSNQDGKTDNDQDIPCNTLHLQTYDPKFESTIGKVYFTDEAGKLFFKNFSVSFEGYELVLDQDNLLIYQDITTLINGIEDRTIGNTDLKTLLDILRKNLLDKNQTTATVVQIQDHIKETSIQIDQGQKDLLDSILLRLSNADTVSAAGGNAYEQARDEILYLLPTNLRAEVGPMFADFEAQAERLEPEAKKEKLNMILKYITDRASAYQMDQNDIQGFIMPQFCKILSHYDIQSNACVVDGSVLNVPTIPVETVWKSGWPTWLKVVLRIVFGGILIVGGVIVFFAVKAKLRANEEEEENEDDGA